VTRTSIRRASRLRLRQVCSTDDRAPRSDTFAQLPDRMRRTSIQVRDTSLNAGGYLDCADNQAPNRWRRRSHERARATASASSLSSPLCGLHQHVSVRKTARHGPNVHPFLPPQVDPDDRALSGRSRLTREPLLGRFPRLPAIRCPSARNRRRVYATRILTSADLQRIQLAVRRVGRDGETFLDDSGVRPATYSRSLPIDEARTAKCKPQTRWKSNGRSWSDEIRKFHEK